MYNFYLCKRHPLDETKTQVFCYHGYNSPLACAVDQVGLCRVELQELQDIYRRFNFEGKSFQEMWGCSISELEGKTILAAVDRVEGDEYIRKIMAIPPARVNDLATLNQALADLGKDTFVQTIDEIMADAPNCILAKQRLELEPEDEIREDAAEDEDESMGMSMS